MNSQYLFVYGTLRSDSNSVWHERLIKPHLTLVGRGTIPGRLYSLGEYPGLVASDDESIRVQGEIYRINAADFSFEALDEYEGCHALTPQPHEYKRAITSVTMDNGEQLKAWCYFWIGSVAGLKPVTQWQ